MGMEDVESKASGSLHRHQGPHSAGIIVTKDENAAADVKDFVDTIRGNITDYYRRLDWRVTGSSPGHRATGPRHSFDKMALEIQKRKGKRERSRGVARLFNFFRASASTILSPVTCW